MMKIIFICLCFFLSIANVFAQKKMAPVTQSVLTGINLPNGSIKDGRSLSVSGAKMLLEMESKKTGATLTAAEVLVLPPVTSGGFNEDSLVKNLADLGWSITPVEKDNKYAWLQKDNRYVITYFSMDKKETSLYFAEAASRPNMNTQGNNTTRFNRLIASRNNRQIIRYNLPLLK